MSGLANSHILEAAIGLALVYQMLALFCTTLNEWLARAFNSRARMLRAAVGHLLAEREFTESFYAHPLLRSLTVSRSDASYIPPHVFSSVLLDLLTPAPAVALCFTDVETAILKLTHPHLRGALLAMARASAGDIDAMRRALELWFSDTMHRISAGYKRRMQSLTLLSGALLTVALNADTLAILQRLPGGSAALPIGWGALPRNSAEWCSRLLGWMLTAGAVSLGAPFWFDVMSRMSHRRSNGTRTGEKFCSRSYNKGSDGQL